MISAVVLAAGESKGTWPFSGIRQKATLPIANVPLVRRIVEGLVSLGVGDIVVVTGHRAEAVRACTADIAGVRFAPQRSQHGPVDAALTGLDGIAGEGVILVCGDIVTPRSNLEKTLTAWRESKSPVLLTADCPADVPHWTTVESEGGLLAGVWGHGNKSKQRWGGVAMAEPETLRRYLLRNPGMMTNVRIGEMPGEEGDIAHSFELMRADGHEVRVIEAEGFLVDVDRPWQIVEANGAVARHALAQLAESVIAEGAIVDDGAEIAPGAKLCIGPGARIGKGCRVGGPLMLGAGASITGGAVLEGSAIIGADTSVRDYCTVGNDAVVGAHCVIGHGAEFQGVMFDTVYLYHYCCITALIGCNVDIGAATVCGTWRFDNGSRSHVVKGHRETPERFGFMTFIGDYVRTGVNVLFMPGVKVGYYSCVGPGAMVYEDVPERTLLTVKQEHTLRPWGPEKYGW